MSSMKEATTGSDLFTKINAHMETLGLKWDRLVEVATYDCPNLTRKNVVLLKLMQDKEYEINTEQKLVFWHGVFDLHVFCKSVHKINYVIDDITKTANLNGH